MMVNTTYTSMLSLTLTLCLCTLATTLPTAMNTQQSATLYWETGRPVLRDGVVDPKKGAATATFINGINETGWDKLYVKAGAGSTGEDQAAFSMGFLEGALTHERIWDMYKVNYADWFQDGAGKKKEEEEELLTTK